MGVINGLQNTGPFLTMQSQIRWCWTGNHAYPCVQLCMYTTDYALKQPACVLEPGPLREDHMLSGTPWQATSFECWALTYYYYFLMHKTISMYKNNKFTMWIIKQTSNTYINSLACKHAFTHTKAKKKKGKKTPCLLYWRKQELWNLLDFNNVHAAARVDNWDGVY